MVKISTYLENLVNSETNGGTQRRDYSLSLEIAITENNISQLVQFGNNLQMEREGTEITHTEGVFF